MLPLRHAVALGLLHGPTELLPISSSGHTTLVPWLAGWPYTELDPESRKAFEVALHAGTAAALLIGPPWRTQPTGPASHGDPAATRRLGSKLGFLLPALVAPALTGYTLGGQIERRFGTPATIAAGLLAGSAAMIAADLRGCALGVGSTPAAWPATAGEDSGPRSMLLVGPLEGLALGLAQSFALIPGVSRSGATLAVARALGFSRRDSNQLSWSVGLPVIVGAALLKGTRLAREGTPRALRLPLAAGAASAFLSTLTSVKLLGPERRASLLPACAAYRGALALLVIRRVRDNTS